MSKIPIKNMTGAPVGEYDLADDLLCTDKGAQVLHEAVVTYMANQRAGNASTLTKGEVHGSGRKPWRQKGTGRARAGYRQSPVWRGGGVVFGPKPRKYTKKMNKKMSRLAFRRAMSDKVLAGQVLILDELKLNAGKTKEFSAVMKNLEISRGALFLMDVRDEKVSLAARNIPRVEVSSVSLASIYSVVRYPLIVVTQQGMTALEERMKK